MTFQPGVSGNPSGRPKSDFRLKELAREHTDKAIETLVMALADSNGRTRVAAAEALLDRGYGRPPQHHELEAGDGLAAALDRAWQRANSGA
jgi:HEAT repeat protein